MSTRRPSLSSCRNWTPTRPPAFWDICQNGCRRKSLIASRRWRTYTPSVLKQIEQSLEENLRDILGGNQDVGGPKVVADILNLTGSSVEKNVLERMDGADPEIAEMVRNMMFVFDDLVKLTDRELQVRLKEVEQKDLVVELKGDEEELKDKVLGNMSERVRQFMTEEMEFLGPMRLIEVEEVQLRIVQQCRQLEDQDQIVITRGDANETFV